ncbi:MAG TPA: hypothetical protein PLS69_04735, partial [Terricaulis sp.]|nr:hypothetical protein [Terricaulis sp.]
MLALVGFFAWAPQLIWDALKSIGAPLVPGFWPQVSSLAAYLHFLPLGLIIAAAGVVFWALYLPIAVYRPKSEDGGTLHVGAMRRYEVNQRKRVMRIEQEDSPIVHWHVRMQIGASLEVANHDRMQFLVIGEPEAQDLILVANCNKRKYALSAPRLRELVRRPDWPAHLAAAGAALASLGEGWAPALLAYVVAWGVLNVLGYAAWRLMETDA